MIGVLTRDRLLRKGVSEPASLVAEIVLRDPVTVHPHETLRQVAQRFAESALGCAPVIEREHPTAC